MALNLNYTPNKLVDITTLTEDQWLDWRRKGIGGSDVAVALNSSPYRTARELYYDKIGVVMADEGPDKSITFQIGHLLEDVVAQIFAKKTGLSVFEDHWMYQHPIFPFLIADVDRFVMLPDGRKAILECKTAHYDMQFKWANGSVPRHYELQVRHYMAVMNIDVAFIACLFSNNENDFVWQKIERDLDEEENTIMELEAFWRNLLSLLTLCPTHQASLKERGLTRDEIDWLGYRTTPTTRLRRIVTELLERGCVLDGVPGFYCQKDTGQWTLDIRGSGIMLPDRNLNGQIEAIQVRLDKVYNQKFYNLTSIDQYYGTQSKCCPHYVGVHEGDEVVCLTEGVMKADIAYSFALGTSYESGFVGLTGVPSYSQFERALEELNSIGVVRINIMVDSDYQVKEEVRKARDRYIEMGVAAGFEVAPITWTQKRKGVDDLYKHLFRNK